MIKNRLKVLLLILPLLAFVPAWGQFDNAFQSTSTMQGSGSPYASEPTIGDNGMVEQPVEMVPNRGRGIGNPEDDPRDNPIGDAVPALLLLAGGYAVFAALRRRKAVR
ncbi:MAG: hypothetical protein MJZ64_00865 [Paludibacteraceae bacterium]|nr:hypothetical protein [Paludibacteraceae bacterium]